MKGGFSFVVAAVIAANASAEQQADNQYYLPQPQYGAPEMPHAQYFQAPAYATEPRYVDERYVAADHGPRYVVQEQPRYVQAQPHY